MRSSEVVILQLRSQWRDASSSYRAEVRLVALNSDDTLRVESDDGTVVDIHRRDVW